MCNIIITVIIVILILLIYYHLSYNEGFVSIIADTTGINKYIGYDKKLNLTVKISGKDYVLVARKRNSCKHKDDSVEVHDKNEHVKDCIGNVLVLMEKSEFDNMIKTKKETDVDDQKICQFKHQIKCERRLRDKYEGEHQSNGSEMQLGVNEEKQKEIDALILSEFNVQCKNEPVECIIPTENNGEFNLLEVKSTNTDIKKFKLVGRVKQGNNYHKHSMNGVIGHINENKVCLDGTINLTNDENSSFELLEIPSKESSEPHFIIRFTTKVALGKKHYLMDNRGVPVTKQKYVGICKDDKCGKVYSRLCFYDKEDNPFVLTFVPKIIQ